LDLRLLVVRLPVVDIIALHQLTVSVHNELEQLLPLVTLVEVFSVLPAHGGHFYHVFLAILGNLNQILNLELVAEAGDALGLALIRSDTEYPILSQLIH